MPEVDVRIAGRAHRLVCGPGEEAHLKRLAAEVDAEAQALAERSGATGELRLLVMTALTLADRLAEARAGSRSTGAAEDAALAEALDSLEAAVARAETS